MHRIGLLITAFLVFTLEAVAAEVSEFRYRAVIVRVVDGDSVLVRIAQWPAELNPVEIRLVGIDTPETGGRAKCEIERGLARRAKQLAISMLPRAGTVTVIWRAGDRDKYGRFLAQILDAKGQDVGATLLRAHLAYQYQGGRKRSWCEPGSSL